MMSTNAVVSDPRSLLHRAVPLVAAQQLVQVHLLGTLDVRLADGRCIPRAAFKTIKNRHLLRLLAWNSGYPVRCELLVEALWPDAPQERGRASLRTAASSLRRTLGGHVAREADALVLEYAQVDVTRFRLLSERARSAFRGGDLPGGLEVAEAALHLYRGEVSADEPTLDLLADAARQLGRMRTELCLESAEANLHLGRYSEAIRVAGQIFEDDMSCERSCRALMRAYARLGERGMALKVYDRCRRSLADELGVGTSAATRSIFAMLLLDDQDAYNI
jgi:SARP family transcriptional regulator, regulator of embCAB operon